MLFHLRDAFRAGDVWLARSRRYGDIRKALLSAPAVADADRTACRLRPVCTTGSPSASSLWNEGLRRLVAAARASAVAGGSIEDQRAPRREDGKPPCRTGPLTWSPTWSPTSPFSPLGWEHINLTGEYRWPGADHRAPRNRLA